MALQLKAFLQTHGVSQAQLAKEVGVSPAVIAQVVNKDLWTVKPSRTELQSAIVSALQTRKLNATSALFTTVPVGVSAPTTQKLLTQQELETMLLRKQILSQLAKKQFGLFQNPFNNDVQQAEDVFLSPEIRRLREYLWNTAKNGGFIAVIGESGAGKSTLRRELCDRVYREDAPIIIIQPCVLAMEDNDVKGKTLKAAAIADAIIYSIAPLEKPKLSMEAKNRQLERLLKDSCEAGFSHCLVIEEAHCLAIPTLKHLKRFFELETGRGFQKLLSIILIGQPELKTKLSERDHAVREVVQRCEIVDLPALDTELEAYLKFKFQRVGKTLDDVFEKEAFEAIRGRLILTKNSKQRSEAISLMYPLMINNLVTAALNVAANLGEKKISADIIKEA